MTNAELKKLATKYAGKLFPAILNDIVTEKDFNRNDRLLTPDEVSIKILTDLQKTILDETQRQNLVELLNIECDIFNNKDWFQFNPKADIYFRGDKETLKPCFIKYFQNEKNVELTKQDIECSKINWVNNYEKIRRIILRPDDTEKWKELISDSLKNFKEPIKPHKEEINNYISNWINNTVSLQEWKRYNKIDVLEELRSFHLDDEKIDNIAQKMYNLFNGLLDETLEYRFCKPFNNVNSFENKIDIAKRDIQLIDDIFNGNVDKLKETRIKQTFLIEDWKKVAIQIDSIIRNKYQKPENFDIHHKDTYFDTQLILNYKKFLSDFLRLAEKSNSDTATTSTERKENRNNPNPKIQDNEVDIQENKMQYTLELLEDLSITSNGKSILSQRRKGAIRGIIIALRNENILPYLSIETLTKIIGEKIGLEINSKLDSSVISDEFEKKTKKYIKDNPL